MVIPVYNVGRYLGDCLESVLRQPVDDVEIILVDDASDDGSAELAADYARRHANITLLHQQHAGVSSARNIGVPHSRGELLTFVDSDDELPDDAWTTMLETLERTGSDFVVGSAERVAGERHIPMPLMRRNHRSTRLGVTIEEMPLMLADVFVWNKIFRRSFWDRAKVWFPERTRYQDQPALTQAFLAADSFDVITDIVYRWRFRDDLSSATQRRKDLSNLNERVATKRMTIDLVRDHGSAEVERVLFSEVLPIDMWEHFRSVPGGSDDYWETLRDAVREFWNPSTIPFEETRVPVQQRLMGWFTSQGRRADLEALIAHIDAHGVVVDDGVFQHPWRSEPGLPEATTRV